MTTQEQFYGEMLPRLEAARHQLLDTIGQYPPPGQERENPHSIQYCSSRIKSAESMTRKLKRRGLPPDRDSALNKVNDALGIRIVCSFADDVYGAAGWLEDRPEFQVLQVKDYIAYPKENGYRSYHMILKILEGPGNGMKAEIQIRTIALDFWASLEHRMKYKKEIAHEKLIREELKRCADEIASVDLSMQTIRDLLRDQVPSHETLR